MTILKIKRNINRQWIVQNELFINRILSKLISHYNYNIRKFFHFLVGVFSELLLLNVHISYFNYDKLLVIKISNQFFIAEKHFTHFYVETK